jgi:hypothetical protein
MKTNQFLLETQYFKEIYSVLIKFGGASSGLGEEESFVSSHTTKNNKKYGPCTEWRFCGHFGFGGKYRRESNSVDYYIEDKNSEREDLEKQINIKLKETYAKYKTIGIELNCRRFF